MAHAQAMECRRRIAQTRQSGRFQPIDLRNAFNAAEISTDLDDPELHVLVIEYEGRIVGEIQWHEETTPNYRHAGIDLYLDPAVHGRGLGTDAVRTLARHLIQAHGHHRIIIDPAADNTAAIRCYTKVGFQPVGIMRRYERGPDGEWHDGLLMDLLAEDLTGYEGVAKGAPDDSMRVEELLDEIAEQWHE